MEFRSIRHNRYGRNSGFSSHPDMCSRPLWRCSTRFGTDAARERLSGREAGLPFERSETRHRECGQNAENRDHDHELDQGETALLNLSIHCADPP
jgi:hypothetical protein